MPSGDPSAEAASTKKRATRGRKSDKKRAQIMAAATRILNARTYALATMSEIAAELDLRDGTLYYYYPNKQALFYACHLRSIDRFSAMIAAADAEGRTGAGKLDLFLDHLVHESERDGPLLYFGDYFHLEPAQRQDVSARAAKVTDDLEAFLVAGIEDGSIVPCETKLVVQLLLGMLIWLAKWVPSVEGLTGDRLLAALDVFSLNGLKSSRRRPRR